MHSCKKQISLTNTAKEKKTSKIAKNYQKIIQKQKEISLIENIAKKSDIYKEGNPEFFQPGSSFSTKTIRNI